MDSVTVICYHILLCHMERHQWAEYVNLGIDGDAVAYQLLQEAAATSVVVKHGVIWSMTPVYAAL